MYYATKRILRSVADVVKLVDTPDLGSGAARRGGSSPSIRTITVLLGLKAVSYRA